MSQENVVEKMRILDMGEGRGKWAREMRARFLVWRKDAGALQWGLFEQEEMEELLEMYEIWIGRLRSTLSVVLLAVGSPTDSFASSEQARNLGVTKIIGRQTRAMSRPPVDYRALGGNIKQPFDSAKSRAGCIKAIYKDDDDEVDVIVEVRPHDEEFSEPVRQLTWLLQGSDKLNSPNAADSHDAHTLTCMGFIDEPANRRSLVLYRSPPSHPWAHTPPTLYELISKGPASKLALNDRFFIAHALAASVLNTHTSGWMHKNICSRSVLMIPRSLNDIKLTPVIVGWDSARPCLELEPNLYRPASQFGMPSQRHSNSDDVYSLGVVLLELGLWKSMSMLFARPLEKNRRFEAGQQQSMFKRVNSVVVSLANDIGLKREMGTRYAEIVQRCLTWQSGTNQEESVVSLIQFRKEIVDGLAMGKKI